MKHCDLIYDLLPLYLEGSCSEESRRIVEEHLHSCPDCSLLLEQLGQEEETGYTQPQMDSKQILKKTAWSMSKRAVASAAAVTAIILYWLIYFWQNAMATIGDYSIFSWSFHEIYSAGCLLVPLLTLIWLFVLIFRSFHHHSWKKNGLLLLILLLLLLGQGSYQLQQVNLIHHSGWAIIEEVPDEYHIVIQRSEGNVCLETNPQVTGLVDCDGSKYLIVYTSRKTSPREGKLEFIQKIRE